MKRLWQLAPKQMWAWVATSYSGLGYFVFPRILYQEAGSSALYSLLLGIAVSFLSVQLNAAAASLVPGRSLAHLAKQVLGKWGGIAFEITPGIHQLVIVAAAFRLLADTIHTAMLQRTPPWAIILATAAVVSYVALSGLEPATRLFQFCVPPLFFLTLFTLVVTLQGFDPVMATPHFVSWVEVWRGFVSHFYMYGGIATISMILAYTDVHRATPWLHTGVALNSLSMLVPFMAVTVTLGPFVAMDTQWPVISAMRLADLPGFVMERLGWIVLLAYTMYMVLFQAGVCFAGGVLVTHLFDLPQEHFRYFVPVFAGSAALIGLFLIPDRLVLEWLLAGILMYTSFFIAVLKPIILYIGGRLRGVGSRGLT